MAGSPAWASSCWSQAVSPSLGRPSWADGSPRRIGNPFVPVLGWTVAWRREGMAPACAGGTLDSAWISITGPLCAGAPGAVIPASSVKASRAEGRFAFMSDPVSGLAHLRTPGLHMSSLRKMRLGYKELGRRTEIRLNRQSGSQLARRCRKLRFNGVATGLELNGVMHGADAMRAMSHTYSNGRI